MNFLFGSCLIIIGLIVFILAIWAFIEITYENADYIYRGYVFSKFYGISILCLIIGYMLIHKKSVFFVLWAVPIYFLGSMAIAMLLNYLINRYEAKK